MKTIKFFIWYIGSKPKNIKDLIYLIGLYKRQKLSELICKRKHKRFMQMNIYGAGKYVYNVYQCDVCKRTHICFELNNSKITIK